MMLLQCLRQAGQASAAGVSADAGVLDLYASKRFFNAWLQQCNPARTPLNAVFGSQAVSNDQNRFCMCFGCGVSCEQKQSSG